MRRVWPNETWPAAWRQAYFYDLAEVYEQPDNLGYAYAYATRFRETLRLVEGAVTPGARVLDVAAAQGNFTLALAERGFRVTWNDLRAELIGYVQQKYETGEVSYAPGNVFDLNFTEPFDAVLMTEVIEHVAHPDEFLRKIAALVRRGGHIIMTTPNGAYFKNELPKFSECADPAAFEAGQFRPNADGHIFLLHPDEIAALAESAGLEVLAQRLFTNPLTTGHVGTERLLRILPRRSVLGLEKFSAALPGTLRRKLLFQTAVLLRKHLPSEGRASARPAFGGRLPVSA